MARRKRSSHFVLPNFLIIGAAKSGTTSLHRQLRQHPDIFLPGGRWKEPTFFSDHGPGRWSRGLDWYESLFSGWQGERAVGEASTSYTKAPFHDGVPARIRQFLPDVKLIYLVRDPVDQIVSHYRQLVFHDGLRDGFEDAIRNQGVLIETARYAYQLQAYRAYFPDTRIRVLPFDRYVQDPVGEARALCRFLGVDDRIELPLERAHNASAERRLMVPVHSGRVYRAVQRVLPAPLLQGFDAMFTRPLPAPDRSAPVLRQLRERLAPEVRELEAMTGLDLAHWRRPS